MMRDRELAAMALQRIFLILLLLVVLCYPLLKEWCRSNVEVSYYCSSQMSCCYWIEEALSEVLQGVDAGL